MFGMGFTEILIIAVIAILFLGPDKLPSALVDIAKFFRSAKGAIGSMKDSIEEEMNIGEIKNEALAYKEELQNASNQLNQITDVQSINSFIDDDVPDIEHKDLAPKAKSTSQEVTFKKKKKIIKEDKNV